MARTKERSKKRSDAMNRYRVNKHRAKKRILQRANNEHDWPLRETNFEQSHNTETSIEDSVSDLNDVDVKSLLRSWVNCHKITTRAVNDLLKIFKRAGLYLRVMYILCLHS